MTTVSYDIDLDYFLKQVPLFSSIPKSQIQKIARCFKVLKYHKNDIIYKQGDSSDSMYIIRTGSVKVFSESGQKSAELELNRGDFFGEMALISELPRNTSVITTLDTTVFQLKRENFIILLKENRNIGLYLSRLYARRLSAGYSSGQKKLGTTFYTISATEAGLGLSHFLYSVSYHISTESTKKVLVIEPHLELETVMNKYGLSASSCPDSGLFDILPANVYKAEDFLWYSHPSGFTVLQVNQGFNQKLVTRLSELMESFKNRYDIVIFSLSHFFDHLERQAVRLCDKNLLLINNTEQGFQTVRAKIDQLEEQSGIGFDRVRVGVSHLFGTTGIARAVLKKRLGLSETPQVWVDRYDEALKDKIDTKKRFPIKGPRAVAREMAGVRIGLALGAGAARGWSHIGVLQVLKKNNIHIDMISGTSMGALVGAIYACKGSIQHLKNTTINQFPTRAKARKGIFDYAVPLRGFLRGKKALNLVAEAIDYADFMDLVIPAYLVGVDLFTGEEILFETGDVAKAVRSSLSLPVVFSPIRHKGRWMVDGGLLNPVPVNILEQKGADKIIAVCVETPNPSEEKKLRAPRIMEVVSRTIRIVHQRATSGFAKKSDIVIYPDVQGFAWDDFHQGKELMSRGVDACEAVLDDIKDLVQI